MKHSQDPARAPEFDLVVLGRTIHTMDVPSSSITAIGIRDGDIAWIGDRRDIRIGRTTDVVDAGDGCITPGLVDAHMHPIMGLDFTRGKDLSHISSLDELHAALTDAFSVKLASSSDDDWILGWGLDPSVVKHRNLSASDIDAAIEERPVFLRLFDGHSAIVNTSAIECAGLTGSEEFVSSARVETDADGVVTGFLIEWEAMQLVLDHIPPAAFEERLSDMIEVLSMMADAGLTGGQALDWADGMLELVQAAEQRGELPIKLWLAPWLMPADDGERIGKALQMQGLRGRRWRVEGVKLLIDGTIDNGTAWLTHPDVNGESTGPLWLNKDSFTDVLHQCSAAGVRTATHAIGDAGVQHVLDAIATAPRLPGEVEEALPQHRIEHLEMIPDGIVKRLAGLNAAASMQPLHCTLYCSGRGTDNWSRRLGDQRVGHAWRLRSLRDAGVTVAIGSDWPIAPFDPLRTMADAQLRREAGRPEQVPVVAREALSAFQVLEGYTTQRARSWGSSNGGRIAIGQPGDLSIFGQDILDTDPELLPDVPVLATVVNGMVRRPRRSSGEGRVS